jgi:hypothetical protein
MTVPVFEPKVSVLLRKNIGRTLIAGGIPASERFKGSRREIDLTPFLGERGHVITRKSVRQPAGMFSIALADKMVVEQFESLYGLIEPMDVVEIRMAREPNRHAGRSLPIVMRGFVAQVRRSEAIVGDSVERSLIISGQDYGRLLQLSQVKYLPNEALGQRLLTYFKFFENYSDRAKPGQPAAEFVAGVLEDVVNKLIDDMRKEAPAAIPGAVSPVQRIRADSSTLLVRDGAISPFGVNQWPGGTVYDMLRYYGDVGPWNELFVEDREDAPYLVYRPTPFKSASGRYIQEPYVSRISLAGRPIDLSDEWLISMEASRSDDGVANYFWVDAMRYMLVEGMTLRLLPLLPGGPNRFFVSDYPNNSPFLYGLRLMELQSQQGERIDNQHEAEHEKRARSAADFVERRRQVIVEQNKDNVVFEVGTMRLRGNEAIKPGRIVRLRRGRENGIVSEQYAHEVTHEFIPFQQFVTTVSFDRGTGLIERLKRESGSQAPYLAEASRAGVYR